MYVIPKTECMYLHLNTTCNHTTTGILTWQMLVQRQTAQFYIVTVKTSFLDVLEVALDEMGGWGDQLHIQVSNYFIEILEIWSYNYFYHRSLWLRQYNILVIENSFFPFFLVYLSLTVKIAPSLERVFKVKCKILFSNEGS